MPGSHPLTFADCILTGAGQVEGPFCSKCGRAMGGERDRFGRWGRGGRVEGACWARNRGFTELRVLNNLFSLLRSMKSLYKSLLGP